MNNSHNSATPKIIGAIVASAILVIGVYTLFINRQNDEQVTSQASSTQTAPTTPLPENNSSTQQSATTQNTTSTSTPSSSFKDGTYSKTVSYRVPEGTTNQLTAEVTVSGGKITGLKSSANYQDKESTKYINGFNDNINNTVTGKDLTDAFVGRVGGASLTSNAFNDIIEAIQADAKA